LKRAAGILIVIAAAAVALYFFFPKFPDINPFPGPEQLHVSVTRPDIPKNITIVNKARVKVRVLVFDPNDAAFETFAAIAKDNFLLDPGQSKKYPRDNYRFKLFKAATKFLEVDQHRKNSEVIGSDATITGNANKLDIAGAPKPPVVFVNSAGEQLKIGVYRHGDGVYLAPARPFFELSDGEKIEWNDAPEVFNLRVFRPQFSDKILATRTDVRDQSQITISREN
jgi:hypothetical protein